MGKMLSIFPSLEELTVAAADQIIGLANAAIEKHGVFRIALAGGSTPRGLYEVLSSEKYASQTDWSAWMIYFGDERLVPLDHEYSNHAMAKESLLDNAPIKPSNLYASPVHLNDSDAVAAEYEHTIRESFEETSVIPKFDVILLGLGSDGHTASLFPGKSTLTVGDRLVVGSTPGVLPPPVNRITFTLPFINAARHVIFLAGGQDKAGAFKAAYHGSSLGSVQQVPAYLVQPQNGDVEWFITDELATA